MKKRSVLFFCFLFFSAIFSTTFASSTGEQTKKLVVLGDSLTEGYGVSKASAFPDLLEKKFKNDKKDWQVINSGVGGSTTASAPSRMKWLLKNKPNAVLLILGGNDGLRGLPLKESEKNLSQALELAQAAHVQVILGGLYMPPNYGKEYTAQFKKMYSDLAGRFHVELIPFILENVAGKAKFMQADGIHPNEEGHKIVAENIYVAIKGHL